MTHRNPAIASISLAVLWDKCTRCTLRQFRRPWIGLLRKYDLISNMVGHRRVEQLVISDIDGLNVDVLDRDLIAVLMEKATGIVHTRVMNGESLGGLQLAGRAGGAETGDGRLSKGVGEARLDSGLRSDDHQVGGHVARQGDEAGDICDLHRRKLAMGGHARIAGGHDEALEQRRLGDLPGERVFAAARSDEQDVHGRALPRPAEGVNPR